MPRELEIANRLVGVDQPVFVVAELSANHGRDLSKARALVQAAAEAGADAIKLQTYTPDTITLDVRTEPFLVPDGSPWAGRTLYDLYAEAQTPWAWHEELAALATHLGLVWFSSPFDPSAVDFLETLDVPAYKVASFELVDIPLLECIAATGKPVIASTGMATEDEIREAVDTLRRSGAGPIALLRTNSGYPADPAEMDLRAMTHLGTSFDVVMGLSDHTLQPLVPAIAVALGAKVIEKHFTLSRAEGGPDAGFSLEPPELAEMVRTVRLAESALGTVRFGPSAGERGSLRFRRSLFVVEDVPRGAAFTRENVRSIRPGLGLHTRHLSGILGRHAARDLVKGTPLSWDLIDD